MSRIWLAVALAILVDRLDTNDSAEIHPCLKGIGARSHPPGTPDNDAEGHWRQLDVACAPYPTGLSPFGPIPTEWTTRPQMIPTTWDVQTVFALDRKQP